MPSIRLSIHFHPNRRSCMSTRLWAMSALSITINRRATEDAWPRTLAFLREHLSGQ